jgi:glycosyltransferase involved in cell wall biosynthesis
VKKKQLSIAFVNHTFFPETYGGAEHQTLRLNLDLYTKNVKTIILSPRLKKETPKQNYIENIFVQRFKVNNFPNLGGRNIFSFFIWSIKIIYWLLKNSKNFNIIHIIHGRLHSVPAIFAAKILKKPVLVKLGRGGEKYFDINVVNNKKIIGPFFAKFILRNVSGWIANSKLIEDDLKKYKIDKVKIHRIYNGINIKNIRINKFRKEKTFVVVGRLEEEKCCDKIINVFSKIPENLNVKLIFLGDGSQQKYLESLTNQLKQSHRIIFKGALDNINKYLINSDFYLSASKSEGMSNALLEAMALGIPALVSNVSGIKEIIINNKNGFIFEPLDENGLYTKLINAINCSEKDYIKLSRLASEHILQNFSINQISDKHIKLYNKLIKNN